MDSTGAMNLVDLMEALAPPIVGNARDIDDLSTCPQLFKSCPRELGAVKTPDRGGVKEFWYSQYPFAHIPVHTLERRGSLPWTPGY